MKPGWYKPPFAPKAHYFGEDGRSLCRRWRCIESILISFNKHLSGQCRACSRRLAETGQLTIKEGAQHADRQA